MKDNTKLRICIFCASSSQVSETYLNAARDLGEMLARESVTIVYGGGSVGLMGAMADGALAANGDIIGIIPDFMVEKEWAHPDVSQMEIVESMHIRKEHMVANTDAVIALPGGSGTLEELLEVITLKRLGLYTKPIIIVNINGYYNSLLSQLKQCVSENFMDKKHLQMWSVIHDVSEVMHIIASAPAWSPESINFAQL